MPQANLSYTQVENFIKRFGSYRTKRAITVGAEGEPDGIAGVHWIALGLRESHLQNINGGAVWSKEEKRWVVAPGIEQDAGVFQISRVHHPNDLKRMPGVMAGTWTPVIGGKTALDVGYVPRYEESLQYVKFEFNEALAFAEDQGVKPPDRARFAIAAHNAGKGGARRGYREGDVDKYTAQGDYSAWVLRHVTLVRQWLNRHPNWKP